MYVPSDWFLHARGSSMPLSPSVCDTEMPNPKKWVKKTKYWHEKKTKEKNIYMKSVFTGSYVKVTGKKRTS